MKIKVDAVLKDINKRGRYLKRLYWINEEYRVLFDQYLEESYSYNDTPNISKLEELRNKLYSLDCR